MEQKPAMPQIQERSSRRPIWVGLMANVLTFLLSIHFYWVPAGAHVHPVIWGVCVFIIASVAFSCMPFTLPLFSRGRPVFSVWLIVVLGMTPLPLAAAMLHHAAWLRGFEIS